MPGEAGLSSKELDELKAHPIDALGEHSNIKGGKKHLPILEGHGCDEEADSVIYGDREAGTSDGVPPGISERNPVDFAGAAGLTSKHIYLAENPLKGLISNPAKDSRDPLKPTLHLRMARSCGLRARLRIRVSVRVRVGQP